MSKETIKPYKNKKSSNEKNDYMQNEKINYRQLIGMMSVGLFSPMIRLLPNSVARLAGNAAWLSPLVSLIPILAYLFFIRAFMKNCEKEEGMGEVICRAIGSVGGRIVLVLYVLWLTLYAGFILRYSGERLMSTVFYNGNLKFFVVVMCLLAIMGSIGKLSSAARSAEIFWPFLVLTLTVVFGFSIMNLDVKKLLPISYRNALSVAEGALPIINVISPWVYGMFLRGYVTDSEKNIEQGTKRVIFLHVIITLLLVTTIGTIGATGTSRMNNAFFVMIRTISLFNTLERVESIVISMWVLSDFVYITFVLTIVGEIVRIILNASSRRWFSLGAGIIAFFLAFLVAPNAFSLVKISEMLIPILNLIFVYIILPVIFAVGKIRKKI